MLRRARRSNASRIDERRYYLGLGRWCQDLSTIPWHVAGVCEPTVLRTEQGIAPAALPALAGVRPTAPRSKWVASMKQLGGCSWLNLERRDSGWRLAKAGKSRGTAAVRANVLFVVRFGNHMLSLGSKGPPRK